MVWKVNIYYSSLSKDMRYWFEGSNDITPPIKKKLIYSNYNWNNNYSISRLTTYALVSLRICTICNH